MSKEKLILLSKEHNKKRTWLKGVLDRRRNRKWLDYSSQIARRILAQIEGNDNLNQAELARLLDVSAQQVSKIVKGQENLTLETIAKLSNALEIELISFPEYKYSYSSSSQVSMVWDFISPYNLWNVGGILGHQEIPSFNAVVKGIPTKIVGAAIGSTWHEPKELKKESKLENLYQRA